MPLLRLLHQISNMYQNVKETQNELKGHIKTPKEIRKRISSGITFLIFLIINLFEYIYCK